MRSSAVCGCDAEPGCLGERRRWTSGGEEDTRSIWDKNWKKHRLGRCHGGLSQPKQEGLRQLSAEEEQHVRRDASLFVCVCLCASCLQERGNLHRQWIDWRSSRSMLPFGTWDCVVLCCVVLCCVVLCCVVRMSSVPLNRGVGWRGVGDEELKGSTETLKLPLELDFPCWTETKSAHQ